MKSLIIFFTALLPMTSMAAGMPNMNEADMQAMMQHAQKMAACMQEIKEDEINKLKETTDQMTKEIKKLCDSGKRKQAQDEAVKFSKKIMKSPTVKKFQKCQAPLNNVLLVDVSKNSKNDNTHVCDTI